MSRGGGSPGNSWALWLQEGGWNVEGGKRSEKVGWKKGRENARRQGREVARMEIREAKAVERQGKNEKALWEPSKKTKIIGHREPGEERETSKSVRCGGNWGQ